MTGGLMPGESTEDKIAVTTCNHCADCCGMKVHIRDGRIVEVDAAEGHPFGRLCVKGRNIMDWVYAKDRITSPMRRVGDKWTEISWDEALDFVAARLDKVKQEHGAKSTVVHVGYSLFGTPASKLAKRFCNVYGSPNFTTINSLCFFARTMGHSLTLNYEAMSILPTYQGSKCIVVWGSNPPQSRLSAAAAISRAKREGAKLIVIDPRAISLAKNADIYARIRPGTDSALALGMLNVIISEGLYDESFVKQWTVGFDKLAEHVKDYPPEKVERITWIPADTIRSIARMYATNRPASIMQGVALDHCTNGVQAGRAVAILVAICGNFDVNGGNRGIFGFPAVQDPLEIEDGVSLEDGIGGDYPLFTRFAKETTSAPLLDVLTTGKPYPVKALIIDGCNAMLTWPNVTKMRKAFQQLELLVVMDMFMTRTAEMADIILPSTTFLESDLIRNFAPSLPLIRLTNKVIEPVGNSWPDWKIWTELGRRMGYEGYFPWKTEDELSFTLLEPYGVKLERLRQEPMGIFYHPFEGEERRYLKGGFNTPSGKVEIYSKTMEQHGYDPLPTFHEPEESLLSRPDLAEEYPLTLITGAKLNVYKHSQFRNLPSFRKYQPDPLIEINTRTAEDHHISNGDMVKLESPRGNIRLRAKVTDDIHPGVVSIQHGWDEANANLLTDDVERDPVSGYPGLKSVLCRLSKAKV